jgi:hypothetical protein
LKEGNHRTFREADDIFSVAANKLSKQETTAETDSQSSSTLDQDIQYLGSLPCIVNSLSRLCDTKGWSFFELNPEQI